MIRDISMNVLVGIQMQIADHGVGFTALFQQG